MQVVDRVQVVIFTVESEHCTEHAYVEHCRVDTRYDKIEFTVFWVPASEELQHVVEFTEVPAASACDRSRVVRKETPGDVCPI